VHSSETTGMVTHPAGGLIVPEQTVISGGTSFGEKHENKNQDK